VTVHVEFPERSYRGDWIAIYVLLCCLGSGIAVSASTGKGILLVAAPAIAIVPLLRLVSGARYSVAFVMVSVAFLALSLANGSRVTSIFLVYSSMLLFESMVRRFSENSWQKGDLLALSLVIWMVIAVSLFDAAMGLPLDTWVRYAEGVSRFSIVEAVPRLRLFFSEPSYLGTFAAASLYWGRRSPRFAVLAAVVLLATHSLFAFVYLSVLVLRRHPRALFVMLVAGLAASLAVVRILGTDIFFLSSGLVRLVGASLFDSMTLPQIFVGAGIGVGDEQLADLFADYGIFDVANGFIWTVFYDLGIIGCALYFLVYCRSLFEVVHLAVLLMNFGAGSFLVPVLQMFVRMNSGMESAVASTQSRGALAFEGMGEPRKAT
jgi:hypothetical protein